MKKLFLNREAWQANNLTKRNRSKRYDKIVALHVYVKQEVRNSVWVVTYLHGPKYFY